MVKLSTISIISLLKLLKKKRIYTFYFISITFKLNFKYSRTLQCIALKMLSKHVLTHILAKLVK